MTRIEQQQLEGTDYAKVKFTGMACEIPEPLHLGDEIVFKITGRVILVGEELDNDHKSRDIAKIKVTSVVMA